MDVRAASASAPRQPHVQLRYGRHPDVEQISLMWKRMAELPMHAETIRSDAHALSAYRQHLRARLAEDCRNLVVADINGRIAGFIFGYLIAADPVRRGVVAHVDSLYVEPSIRCRGLGTALLRAFLDDARGRGATELTINVVRGNPALSFYQKLGLVPWQYTMRTSLVAAEGLRPGIGERAEGWPDEGAAAGQA